MKIDASHYVIKAYISQPEKDNKMHSVTFYSNFSIHYQKRSKNERANTLSWRSDHKEEKEHRSYLILVEDTNDILRYNHMIETNSLIILNGEWEERVKKT
jgi:hypothetical protein